MEYLKRLGRKVTRVKTIADSLHQTSLRRCLNTFDMTLLGIGHMVGAGIYVLTGTVARRMAGPSAVLSYLLAGVASLLSALCYAEFGARIPKAGSGYSYTYSTLGEIWAFVIGWNLILEHTIGTASIARAWSGSVDSIFNGAIRNWTLTYIGRLSENGDWVSEYVDFLAAGITVIVFVIVTAGVKQSVNFNSTFTILNGVVILFTVCAGFSQADIANWEDNQHGGYFPFGIGGTLSGAASCFYAYIGFEGIAISSEEAKTPEKSVPRATLMAMGVVTLVYMAASSSLTLMVPYYDVSETAALPEAFVRVGMEWAKYVVAVGTLLGITSSLAGSAFSQPRTVYAMAEDGLLFRFLGYIHPRTQTPVFSILIFGFISTIMTAVLALQTLVEFVSIGTLLSYTVVAACTVIARYTPDSRHSHMDIPGLSTKENEENVPIVQKSRSYGIVGELKQRFGEFAVFRRFGVTSAVCLLLMLLVALSALLVFCRGYLMKGTWWAVVVVVVLVVGVVFFYVVIVGHERNDSVRTFQMPLVPLLPILSILLNLMLMMSMSYLAWVRLVVWAILGVLLYFTYGFRHSRENQTQEGHIPICEYHEDPALPDDCSDPTISSGNSSGLGAPFAQR